MVLGSPSQELYQKPAGNERQQRPEGLEHYHRTGDLRPYHSSLTPFQGDWKKPDVGLMSCSPPFSSVPFDHSQDKTAVSCAKADRGPLSAFLPNTDWRKLVDQAYLVCVRRLVLGCGEVHLSRDPSTTPSTTAPFDLPSCTAILETTSCHWRPGRLAGWFRMTA